MNGLLLLAAAVTLYALHKRQDDREDTGRLLPRRRNPAPTAAEKRELKAARALSMEFHGVEEVIELSPHERQLPRYVVALGSMPDMEYEPRRGSDKAGWRWQHESGDRGVFRKKSRKKPILAADPHTGRPLIVPMKSPIRFNENEGLIG